MIEAKFRSIFDSRSNVTPEWREETKQKIEALSEISIINKLEDITRELEGLRRETRRWLAGRDTRGLNWLIGDVDSKCFWGFPDALLDRLEERLSAEDMGWITRTYQRRERLRMVESMLSDALYVKQEGCERPF